MKKLMVATLLGLGAVVATAVPASADSLTYSGRWFHDNRECVLTGLAVSKGPYECRWNAGGSVWELWWS
ncbi:hypothetical protein [Amycolatopsis samaneae]|uniref:Secreted protein n=1 Tax=Amycolatopsis samaneae TaxID=664691 RepID=A0ABW5GRB6_9PSEU